MRNRAMQRSTRGAKLPSLVLCVALLGVWLLASGQAQVNSGSNGSDGALDYSGSGSPTNIVIDMHDHPNGVYQYTYVNISSCWRFSFVPNANNTPVIWFVQSNVVINGIVDVSGMDAANVSG